jgi:hypothetical protein
MGRIAARGYWEWAIKSSWPSADQVKRPDTEPGRRESDGNKNGISPKVFLLGNSPDMRSYKKTKDNACSPQVRFHLHAALRYSGGRVTSKENKMSDPAL